MREGTTQETQEMRHLGSHARVRFSTVPWLKELKPTYSTRHRHRP